MHHSVLPVDEEIAHQVAQRHVAREFERGGCLSRQIHRVQIEEEEGCRIGHEVHDDLGKRAVSQHLPHPRAALVDVVQREERAIEMETRERDDAEEERMGHEMGGDSRENTVI